MAPPIWAELFVKVLLLTVRLPSAEMAPPSVEAELLVNSHPVTVSEPLAWLIAPPPAAVDPPEIFRPEMVTVPDVMENTLKLPPPEMVSWLAPGPVIVTFWLMLGRALVSVIWPVTLKSIVSPAAKLLRQYRSVLGLDVLVSAFEVTVQVAAHAPAEPKHKTATKTTRRRNPDGRRSSVPFGEKTEKLT